MARRVCGLCETQVSTVAVACPSCGKKFVKVWVGGALLLAGSGVLALAGIWLLYRSASLPLDASTGALGEDMLAAVALFAVAASLLWKRSDLQRRRDF